MPENKSECAIKAINKDRIVIKDITLDGNKEEKPQTVAGINYKRVRGFRNKVCFLNMDSGSGKILFCVR